MRTCSHCCWRTTDNYHRVCDSCLTSHSPKDREEWDIDHFLAFYSTNIVSEFNIQLDKGKRYYGLELEYVFDAENEGIFHSQVNTIRNKLPDRYGMLKIDGSILSRYNVGAELVTTPKENINEHLDNLKFLYDLNFLTVKRNTGMHVHVSRSSLSALTIGKILVFLNDRKNRRFITRIAGRNSQMYSSFKEKKLTDGKNHYDFSRYESINLQPFHTIEFRIFRSPENYFQLCYRLQFVKAVIEFCENTSYRNLSFTHFKQYLKETHYKHLKKFIFSSLFV